MDCGDINMIIHIAFVRDNNHILKLTSVIQDVYSDNAHTAFMLIVIHSLQCGACYRLNGATQTYTFHASHIHVNTYLCA